MRSIELFGTEVAPACAPRWRRERQRDSRRTRIRIPSRSTRDSHPRLHRERAASARRASPPPRRSACADRGYRTIVMSTDIAHSLGDAFDRELGPVPLEIAPNLWAQESDVFYNVARYWGRDPGVRRIGPALARAGRGDGRGDDGPARHGRGRVTALDRRPPRLRPLRRGRRGRGPDRRDAAPPPAARGGEVVDGEGRADRPQDHQAHRSAHPARRRHADAERRGLQRRRRAVQPP